ncbi:MAG TPA: symmetrical bis(5'-nucleosyl)-tetraphosphatase [Quisquiliibacterium sp.]|nr:symmetrical bis(5'-nucleosyl)-tetraphosphatase [Quisquiliibacterium sp.]
MSATPVAIGDVQGCCDSLQALIARVDRDAPDAPLWFCGDLVNRGPKSLQTLRFVRALGARAVVVLGNHDLHLLAVAYGIRAAHRSDTLDEILAAPDRDALLDWLRTRPLAHFDRGHLLVHAGVLPQWSAARAVQLSGEVSARLGGTDARAFLATMYGNEPARWDDALPGADRWRVVVNALTRLRFCTPSGLMEFATKDVADAAPAGYLPWFDTRRASADVTVVFGHWSHLGLVMRPNLLALDTGCVWGNRLTAVSLETDPAARRVWQVECRDARPDTAGPD